MLSIQKIRTLVSRTQALDWISSLLTSIGFDTTSWQDGSFERTHLVTIATIAADLAEVARIYTKLSVNGYSSGDALTELSLSRFSNARGAGARAAGPMTLRSVAKTPYDIKPGQLIATTRDGVRFRNTTGTTIFASDGNVVSATCNWEAVLEGVTGNVPKGTVNRLETPLAGVTISNDVGNPWFSIRAGKDPERDDTLQRRNATKFARLSAELTAAAYENIAINLGASKVTLHDQNPRGPGTLDVYVAGQNSVLSDAEMATMQAEFAKRIFFTTAAWAHPWVDGANPSRVAIRKPDTQALNFTATVYHSASVKASDVRADVAAALNGLLARTPIGGFSFTPGPQNILPVDDIVEAIRAVDGVKKVVLDLTADVLVNPLKLLVQGTWYLNPIAVT